MKNLFIHLNSLLLIEVFILFNMNLFGQLSAPSVNNVYGGRINGISVVSTGVNTSRVYIATESANSVFYADVTTTPGLESFGTFTVMPGLDDAAGHGSGISKIYAHQTSGYLFFSLNNNLYKTISSSSTVTLVEGAPVSDFIIYGDYIFYIKDSNFYYAQIDGSGNLVSSGTIALGTTLTSPSIKINSANSKVYITSLTATPTMYKSNANYNGLSGTSFFSALTLGLLSASVTSWDAFGIGPDGSLFLGGDDNSNKYVQYSTNDGTNWLGGSISVGGVAGPNFSFAGSTSPYKVCFAKAYSTFTTSTGFSSWIDFGNVSSETHPNDGSAFVDPNNNQIIYVTTDQGIGASKDGGANLFEIDNGVEAVQVNDFDMASNKIWGWLASKAGVRKVSDFRTSPTWTNAMFPTFDGSPYYSAEMNNDKDDTAYVGNVRIYKTTNSGTGWTRIFSAEDAPYLFGSMARVEAIEVCPTNENLVTAGYFIDGTSQGGFFYSTNAGSSWNQQLLKTASGYNDADVYDIVFSNEGPNPVAYIGVNYDTSVAISDRARSVYRAEWSGSAWTVRNDFDLSYTAVGYAITATIMDLFVSGDTIFAVGTDATTNHPIAYYKAVAGTNLWTTLTTSGFPTSSPGFLKYGRAGSYGADTIFVAVDNQIYYMQKSASSWTTGYTYPAGTQINVLYYDELLVGTGTGLYGQNTENGYLPVELISFTANVDGDKVLLRWKTATELNNYGFEIERKAYPKPLPKEGAFKTPLPFGKEVEDGLWVKIDFVNGNGNSNSAIDYTSVDNNVISGKYLYRLKQIDNDGSYKFSPEVEVEIGTPTKYSLEQNYPNPFNPTTTISFAIPEETKVTLSIYNQLGERVATLVNEKLEAGNHLAIWNAVHFASGIYFYEIRTERFSSVKKLILLK
ncbi:MAG: T9SS type A sorting domain-containing protein [Ignavibacteria bacterium]|nr:T9SS type A sorting domain-containing protein [Ignavibacteria bacterium]